MPEAARERPAPARSATQVVAAPAPAVPGTLRPGVGGSRLSPGEVLHLQRTVGNRAVARLLAPAAGGGPPTLQRANLRWSRDPSPVVVDIDFGKRSGAQEDHTTAFAAFEMAVLHNLKGRTLKQAVVELFLLANEITELARYGDYRNAYLANEVGRLKERLYGLIEAADDNPLYVAGELGDAIDDYLRVRNLVPGTHLPRSEAKRPPGYKGGGKIEKEGKMELGSALSELRSGKGFDDVRGQVVSAFTKLLDYVTTRTTLPDEHGLATVAAQHFQSLMQVDPLLARHANPILEIWIQMVFDQWKTVIKLDAGSLAATIRGMVRIYVGPHTEDVPDDLVEDEAGDLTFGTATGTSPFDFTGKELMGGARLIDPATIPVYQRISLLNRMAEQGLIAAAQIIQYIIDHPEKQAEVLDNLGFLFVVAPDGRVFFRLRGG